MDNNRLQEEERVKRLFERAKRLANAKRPAKRFIKPAGLLSIIVGVVFMLYAFFPPVSGWIIDSFGKVIALLCKYPTRMLAGIFGCILIFLGVKGLRYTG